MRIYEDLRVVQARLALLQNALVVVMLLLAGVFWHLQVLRGRYFKTLAENNRSRLVPIAAPRGPLLDRQGRILVANRPSFNIVVRPEHVEDLDDLVRRLAVLLNVGEAQIRERLAARASPFRPVVIRQDASLADVAALEARRLEFPDVSVDVVPLRSYPLAAAAAHSLGRVGEIQAAQLQLKEFASQKPGDLVGQAGVELQYNRALLGRDGSLRLVVNSRGREVRELDREAPEDGPSLTLTLDQQLQVVAERAFGGRAGSAVAVDPATGEILAMTSVPAYDPNQFATGIDAAAWQRLTSDPDTPLMNRVIQGQYAPGSVFKIVVAAAALEEGLVTPRTALFCPGHLAIYDTVFRCNRPEGHGWVSLRQALAQSCNVYFYQVGARLEIDRIARWAKRLGLGAPAGVDLPHEQPGLVPSSDWKLRTQRVPWYAGETISVAIGQGQVTATPLQLARLAALVANGGHLVTPHLVKAIGSEPRREAPPDEARLRPETVAAIREGMCAVVNEHGTGWRAQLASVEVCGKTGSSQVVASRSKQPISQATMPHGWFIAFAPRERPRIALAVLVEHGGGGGQAAAPVAREILAHFFRETGAPSAPVAD
ncbi:MAG TPA: penicillin-binding protein 2 [Vicinamibacteria bacterium]|nr:penicillin-binding protein 2 [Vicinamibacteria bacterium]